MGTARRWDTHAADLAAIEKLHKKNIEVTLSQDPQGLLDLWNATVQFLDTGHFALETHLEEIAVAMRQFLAKAGAV
jgi:hypothetical protein